MKQSEEYISQLLCKEGVIARFVAGDIIFKPEQTPQYLFYIRNGAVYIAQGSTPNIPLIRLSAGSILGTREFMTGAEYKLSAITEENAVLLKLDRPKFDELFREDIRFRMFVVKSISGEIISLDQGYE